MIITWDNIDNFKITKLGNFKYKNNAYYLIENGCNNCGDSYFVQRYIYNKGKGLFCSHTCSMSGSNNSMFGVKGDMAPSWKGGVKQSKLSSYYTYYPQLKPYGIICRRNKQNSDILEVKCMYCDKWYTPTQSSIRCKLLCIYNINQGESNLYCSDGCKQSCPTYHQRNYPKGYKTNTSREVQPQLRKLVLERDKWECIKCNSDENGLHCHHIEGVELNPIESADMDNCITVCKKCHKEIHSKDGCTYNDYRRKKCK